jgi:hypothetical protein
VGAEVRIRHGESMVPALVLEAPPSP